MKKVNDSSFKDSKVQCIGKIPENWLIRKIKHISRTVAGGTPDTEINIYWDGSIPWLPSGMVQDNIIRKSDAYRFITFEGLIHSATKKIKKNSVLIALTGATCANIAYLTFSATANQSVVSVEVNKGVNSKFLYYFLRSQREQILLKKTGGAQTSIDEQDVKNIICVYPELEEQSNISDFLDARIYKINKSIQKDNRLIYLLKKKKDALIKFAVTKGLDSKTKMKASGIDWIGEFPVGWEIKKLKHFSRIVTGSTPDSDNEVFWDGDIKWVTPADLSSREKYISDSRRKITEKGYNSCGTSFVSKGAIILATRAPIGYPTIVNNRLCFNQGCKAFEVIKGFIPDYCYYFLNGFEEVLNSLGNITTFGELSRDNLASFPFLQPSLQEQKRIVQYLDQKTININNTIMSIKRKIDLLTEYKTSLIYHSVTGKINTRSVN